jgi:tetratricopeptide (TPR) repeat protein
MRGLTGLRFTVLLGLVLSTAGLAPAQDDRSLMMLQVKSYDLLEAGKFDQAKEIYGQILQKDPNNPLALNNLAAITAREGKSREALTLLEQALPRARGYKVKVNRVCDVAAVCLAFRPTMEVYADQELAPLVQLNIELLKSRLTPQSRKD